MKKKIFLISIAVVMIPLFIFLSYRLVGFMDYQSSLSDLEKYFFAWNEETIKQFEYNKRNYVISRYHDNSSSWSHLNLLLKDNNNYYVLKNIRKCDTPVNGKNLYLKDNALYIHCIGKEGIIDKYTINDLDVEKETLRFIFKDTPNISQLHIGIDKVDSEYIYLSSLFKVDATIKDEPRVKCSFDDRKCLYY